MRKRIEIFKKKIKLFSFLCLILLVLFVNLGPIFAISRGDYLEEDTEGNKKEQQLLRKIEIIHETYPQQIDEEALYATLVHRGNLTDYIEDSYDEDFDEDEYRDVWTDLQASFTKLTSDTFAYAQLLGNFIQACIKCWIDPEDTDGDGEDDTEGYYEENCVLETVIDMYADQWSHTTDVNLEQEIKKPKAVDLLTAATIVMLDSSGWIGTYSDEKYEEALAGEGLVGNLIHRDNLISNFVATLMNGVFCTVRNVMDIATDGAFDEFALGTYRPGTDFEELKGFTSQGTSIADKLSRFYTMDKICALGFIGGTYNHVQNPDLSTEEGKERYQTKKDIVAKEIIGLAQDLRNSSGGGSNNCVVNPSSSGAFATWKQGDPQWGSISLGGGGSMASIGCLVTSFAITIARSGTQITNLPSGYSSFNPGALVTVLNKNGGFTGGGAFTWNGYQSIAPNVKYYPFVHTNITNTADLAETLSAELSTPAEGKYQKFIIINIHHNNSSQHWIAVDSVTDNEVTLFDPGGVAGNTLDANYSGWVVDGYKVIYATDVLFGQAGTSTGGTSGSNIYCETSGNIVIPEEYGNGGYTVTVYNDWNWVYAQGEVYDKWAAAGSQWDDGIAVIDGRYLIACTETFGRVGDKVDFFLDDGTKIPCIIADIKNPGDAGYNQWGHNNGQNVLEFEVSHVAFYNTYHQSNPGTNGWHMEWAGKRVSSATNLGENILG